jgi:hypothetical protein
VNTWDGVSQTAGSEWTTQYGGWLDVNVTCPDYPTTRCYLNGWINWHRDGNFDNTDSAPGAGGDRVFNNKEVVPGLNRLKLNVAYLPPPPYTGLNVYARFRVTAGTVDSPSAVGGGGCGEVEDYEFKLSDLTQTPVTLARFHAHNVGGRTRLEWTTATEAGNFGFDVYTASPVSKGRERLTGEPISSTATDPTQPQEYSFEAAASAPATQFYLEDIDIYGARRLHGPFELDKQYGKRPDPVETDWTSIRKEHDRRGKEQLQSAFMALASDKAKNPPRANLLVGTDGLYRVTYEALLGAGFDFGEVSPSELSLVSRGAAIPIEVTGPAGKFGPGSAIQFYGTAAKSIYTYNNVYTLGADKERARRIDVDHTPASPTATVPISYLETVKVENPKGYDFASVASDPWFEASMIAYTNRISRSFPITLDWIAASTGASLAVNYYGVTNWPASPDHHVLLQFNGETRHSDLFDGRTNRTVTASLPDELVREGANTVTFVLPGDTGVDWDMVRIKSYSVTYPRQFVARNGRLTFEATGNVFQVDRLSSPNAIVYRISGTEVERLSNVRVENHGIGYSVRFAGSDQAAKYVVATAETALTPTFSVPRYPTDLDEGPAQLLVISHPDFIDHLGPLVAARQAEGLSVKVVDVRDVYAQYRHGIFDATAIKAFIADAAAKMGTQFVLLVGGDTYDYRDDLKKGTISFIPTLYAQTDDIVTYAPVDPLYGDLDGDDVPEVAVGRLPVRTAAELDSVIRKILAYDNDGRERSAVFAADAAEQGVSYKAISQSLIASLPPGWVTQQANLDDAGLAKARATLLNAMNSGVALVNFVGHSSYSIWTFDPLLDNKDAVALTNFGKPVFVSQFGCWNTYFVSPYYDTLGHAFMLSGDQGAVGVMGASTLTEVESGAILGQTLFPRLATPGKRIGTAIIEAKRETAARSVDGTDVLLGWVLLGDPTMMIQR